MVEYTCKGTIHHRHTCKGTIHHTDTHTTHRLSSSKGALKYIYKGYTSQAHMSLSRAPCKGTIHDKHMCKDNTHILYMASTHVPPYLLGVDDKQTIGTVA